jgi:hypothetical protein
MTTSPTISRAVLPLWAADGEAFRRGKCSPFRTCWMTYLILMMILILTTTGSVTLVAHIRRFSAKLWGRRQDVAEAMS